MATTKEVPLTRDTMIAACRDYGLTPFIVSDDSIDGLYNYLSLLMKWNRVMNLVGKTRWRDALRLLLADSVHVFSLITALQKQGALPDHPRTWDLGAGAGLPGIPLRLIWQNGEYTLVDAREKRTLFLKTVLASHDFGATTVVQDRVERFMPTQPPAHLVISRAFMPWEQVLDLITPHMEPGGIAIFLTLASAPAVYKAGASGSVWKLLREECYTIDKDTRYLWSMRSVVS